MRHVTIRNPRTGTLLGDRIGVADRWWLRLLGVLGRRGLGRGEGLLIVPCAGVHTYFMRFPLDVAFLDGTGAVLAAYPGLQPGTRTRWHRGARAALELPVGVLDESGTAMGDRLSWLNGTRAAGSEGLQP